MIDFAGQVVIVTGGGRGLGREHCRLLAMRGAQIVVNDLGVTTVGETTGENPAQEVADEITAAGGAAVANRVDVGSREGPAQVVEQAMDSFGRVDGVIHNAGSVTFSSFEDLSFEAYRETTAVHLDGGFLLAKAAWPHMRRQAYGRFVFITSQVALSGLHNLAHYMVAKTGVTGLARALALEGEQVGIRANALGVTAYTRLMTGFFRGAADGRPAPDHMLGDAERWWRDRMPAKIVSPAAVWLASRACDVNGVILDSGGGHTVHQYLNTTPGFFDADLTLDSFHENRGKILAREGARPFAHSGELSVWRRERIAADMS